MAFQNEKKRKQAGKILSFNRCSRTTSMYIKIESWLRGIFSFSLIFIHNYKKIRIAGIALQDATKSFSLYPIVSTKQIGISIKDWTGLPEYFLIPLPQQRWKVGRTPSSVIKPSNPNTSMSDPLVSTGYPSIFWVHMQNSVPEFMLRQRGGLEEIFWSSFSALLLTQMRLLKTAEY